MTLRARLGINTCFAVKRWPRPADWAPIVRNELGLSLVQHSLDLVDLDDAVGDAAAVVRSAKRSGLEFHSTFTGLAAYSSNLLMGPNLAGRDRAEAWFRQAIDYTRRVGAGGTGGHVGAMSVPDGADPDRRAARWGDLRGRLGRLTAAAREAGLEFFLVENLAAAREPSTMTDIERLLTMGDATHVPLRLCLDVGHMCVPGTSGLDRDPYAWLTRFGASAGVVQLQQSDASGDHHWPFTAARNAEGRIVASQVIDALEAGAADDATLILEIIPSFEQDDDEVLADLRESVDYWREELGRRGIAIH
jgi:D-erythrulose 1-phosphate 3-epimerase